MSDTKKCPCHYPILTTYTDGMVTCTCGNCGMDMKALVGDRFGPLVSVEQAEESRLERQRRYSASMGGLEPREESRWPAWLRDI